MRLVTSNGLQQLRKGMSGQVTPLAPSKVYLDLTQDCNMYCVMCRDLPGKTGRIMKQGLFQRIVDETSCGAMSYSLFNWGESLLLPDFFERLDYLVQKKRPEALIDLSTNGMLLTRETSKRLLDNNVEITVSFDSAVKADFERIRRGGRFDLICKNLETAAKLAADMDPFRAPGAYIAIQKGNWADLPDIIRLLNSMGVRRVGMGAVAGPEEYKLEKTPSVVEKIGETIVLAEKFNMVVDLYPTCLGDYIWDGDHYAPKKDFLVDTNCDAPFNTVSIAWNGDVYLCCNVGTMVESVCEKSFAEVWMGERYQQLRERVNREESMPEMCKRCPWVNRF